VFDRRQYEAELRFPATVNGGVPDARGSTE
jgi:hypothetical protein